MTLALPLVSEQVSLDLSYQGPTCGDRGQGSTLERQV
jgi:hypothetical protein